MKKRARILILLLPLLILTGACDFTNLIIVKVSDLFTLTDGSPSRILKGEGVVSIQTGSDKTCKENLEKIDKITEHYFQPVEPGECETEEELKNFYKRKVRFSVMREESWKTSPELTAVLVRPGEKEFYFGIGLSSKRFLELQKEITDTFYQSVEVENLSYELILQNDTERKITGTIGSVYFNGTPFAFGSEYSVSPGASARIKISNVLKDSLYQRGSGFFASVKRETK